MTVEQLIALLSEIKDKTKLVAVSNETLVTSVEEYGDYIIVADSSNQEAVPDILH